MGVKLRERKLQKGKVRFYLDIIHNGKREYKFLDITITPSDKNEDKKSKKEIAKAIRAQVELEIATKGTDYIPESKKRVDFLEFLDNFLEQYQKKDIRMISATIKKFKEFVNSDALNARQVDKAYIERYRDFLTSYSSGLKGESPHNYFTRFKKILKEAYHQNVLSNNPGADVHFKNTSKKHTVKKEVLSAEEIVKLYNTDCGNAEVKRAFLFSCFTGLGLAEIKRLKWSNLKNDKLRIHRSKTGILINQDLSSSAKKLIGEKNTNEMLVFNVDISDTAVNKNLQNWIKRAKIDKKITFYCGRHTFATQLLLNGTNLKTVSDLLGQTEIKHTVKYLNYLEEDRKNAINKLIIL